MTHLHFSRTLVTERISKKSYEVGFTSPCLRVFFPTDLAALLSLAQQHIPGARLVEELGREAVINLPQMAAKDSSLGVFLSELDQRMTDLGISSYGLSDSTLEEVSAGFSDSPSNTSRMKSKGFRLPSFHISQKKKC